MFLINELKKQQKDLYVKLILVMLNIDDVLYYKKSLETSRFSYISTQGKQNVKKIFSLFDDVKNDGLHCIT